MQDGPNSPANSHVPYIIVDCDPGIDDALALLMLAQLHQTGRLIIDSVFTVGGNVPVTQTASNAASVLERAGLPELVIVSGANTPLGGPRTIKNSISIHGKDGLGGLAISPRTQASVSQNPGKDLASRILACPSRPILLCIGPLTNVALALRSNPAIIAKLFRVIIMGGALGNPPGNITPLAEFNFHIDPVATSIVMASGLPIELVPLDVTQAVPFENHDLDGLSDFARSLLAASLRTHHEFLGIENCYVHDAVAASVLLDSDLARLSLVRMTVATSGADAGHVAIDGEGTQGGSAVEVVSYIDSVGVKELFHALLGAPTVVSEAERMRLHVGRNT